MWKIETNRIYFFVLPNNVHDVNAWIFTYYLPNPLMLPWPCGQETKIRFRFYQLCVLQKKTPWGCFSLWILTFLLGFLQGWCIYLAADIISKNILLLLGPHEQHSPCVWQLICSLLQTTFLTSEECLIKMFVKHKCNDVLFSVRALHWLE